MMFPGLLAGSTLEERKSPPAPGPAPSMALFNATPSARTGMGPDFSMGMSALPKSDPKADEDKRPFLQRVQDFFKDEEKVAKFIMALEPLRGYGARPGAAAGFAETVLKEGRARREAGRETQQFLDFLVQRGQLSPQQVEQLKGSPRLAEAITEAYLSNQIAKNNETFGLTPIPVVDEDGEVSYVQLSNKGGMQPIELPEGTRPAANTYNVDTGTEILTLDARTNQILSVTKKNIREAASEKAIGSATGAAEGETLAGADAALDSSNNALNLIGSLLGEPIIIDGNITYEGTKGLQDATGPINGQFDPETKTGALMLTQEGIDTVPKIQQLQGTVFLEAFQNLKGGGQITEIESRQAVQAIARLQRTQSTPAFIEALLELQAILLQGQRRLQRLQERSGNNAGNNNANNIGGNDGGPTVRDLADTILNGGEI